MVVVKEKREATDELLKDMAVQREGAQKLQAVATVEAEKAGVQGRSRQNFCRLR